MTNPVRGGNEATKVVTAADLPRITGPAPGAPSTEAVGEVRRREAELLTESELERRRLIGDDWTTNVELEQAVAEVKRARGVESMPAYELAKLLPEHLRKPFWEEAVEYYLADALALTEAVERDGCWIPRAEANQLRSDLAAMTSVVEAAKAWALATFGGNLAPIDGDEDHFGETELALAAAVDVYTNREADRG